MDKKLPENIIKIQTEFNNHNAIESILKKIYIPSKNSRKGQNGKLLIIGGSSLFHSAPIWSAETATHFVDMVHFASTSENNGIFKRLKEKFRGGIVIDRRNLNDYIKEDDAVLIGIGMLRSTTTFNELPKNLCDILNLKDEGALTKSLTEYVIMNMKNKKIVLDAGSLQMLNKELLIDFANKCPNKDFLPVITPHYGEFEKLFSINLVNLNDSQKIEAVYKMAQKFKCVILCKSRVDIVASQDRVVIVEGGNQGLTKGGTGDILSGLVASFATKSPAFESAVLSSYLIKKTADRVSKKMGIWYNASNILNEIPVTLNDLVYNN